MVRGCAKLAPHFVSFFAVGVFGANFFFIVRYA